jgi:hypothetical protein
MCEFCSSAVDSFFCDNAPHHWVVWCSVLQDSFTVPSSGTFDPWRWYHHAVHKLWVPITQRCNLVSCKNGELTILCLCQVRFSSCYCVFVFCFPLRATNLTHHLSFFHLIALTELKDQWLWSLLSFGLFVPLLLLLYVYLNVDCSWFCGLLTFLVWDL